MKALKQNIRVPGNHEIIIKVPSYIPENEVVETIIIINDEPVSFNQKITKLKEAVQDKIFVEDINEISKDFKIVDSIVRG